LKLSKQQKQSNFFFDKISDQWSHNAYLKSNKILNVIKQRNQYVTDISRRLLSKKSKILDVGCGSGELVISLSKLGFDAQGIDFSEELYLSMNDISKMKKDGMVFGSHGYSHYWMNTLNENELIDEFSRNKEFLSKISGDNLLMCYPHGGYNNLVMKKLEENNFQFALTTEVGDAKLDRESRFKLKRFDCNDFPPISSTNNLISV
jgi:hypothetical protein